MASVLIIDDERSIRNTLREILEFEKLNVKDSEDVDQIMAEIQKLINSLNIKVSQELHRGKPELMLKKQDFKS
jgi:DNA-binding NtrC family response regulator